MRLTRLRLQNFLSHRETDVRFHESGITLVSGENAMGKSSLFDALRFALFGVRFQKPRALVTRGEKSMGVEAEFSHRGHTYILAREYAAIRKDFKATRAEARMDDRPAVLGGVSDLDTFVVRQLGLNHEMFRYSVMAVQGEVMGVLGLSPGERRTVFERMFGYHHLRLVGEAAVSIAGDEEKGLSGLLMARGYNSPADLDRDMEGKKQTSEESNALLSGVMAEKERLASEEERLLREGQEIEAEEMSVKESETERAALNREIKVREEEIARMEAWVAEQNQKILELPRVRELLKKLEKPRAELVKLREEEELAAAEERLATELASLEKRLEEIRGYEEIVKKLLPAHEAFLRLREDEEKTRAELDGLKEQLGEAGALTASLSQIQKERGEVEGKIAVLPGETREQILARIEEKESEARKTEATRGAAEERAKRARKDSEALETLGDTCPLCKQKLTHEHRAAVREQLEAEFQKAMDAVKEYSAKTNTIREEIETLKEMATVSEQREKLTEQLARLLAKEREMRKHLEGMAGVREKHEALNNKIVRLRKEIKNLEPAEREFAAAEDFIGRNPGSDIELAIKKAREETERFAGKRAFPGMGPDEIRGRIKNLLPAEREAIKLSSEIENLEKLAGEIKKQESVLEKKKAEITEKRMRLGELAAVEVARARLNERKKAHNEARENLQRRKDSATEKEVSLRKEAEAMARELAALSELRGNVEQAREKTSLFSEIGKRLLAPQGIEREFAIAMRRLEDNLNACFQDFSFSGLESIYLNNEFVPVKIDEQGREIERLSGGEQVAMGIATRFAIAKALMGTESESLFLDEPTHNLDSERISSLQDILRQFKLHPATPQVIIITHDEDMKVVADTVIEVVKEGGVSRIVE